MRPRKPLPRSTKPIKRTAVKKRRSKPRPGRLEGDDLGALRQACFDRDNGCCVVCGTRLLFNAPPEWDNSFHMAHKHGKRMWGDHIDNVQTECGRDHRAYHQNGPSRGKIVPSKHS